MFKYTSKRKEGLVSLDINVNACLKAYYLEGWNTWQKIATIGPHQSVEERTERFGKNCTWHNLTDIRRSPEWAGTAAQFAIENNLTVDETLIKAIYKPREVVSSESTPTAEPNDVASLVLELTDRVETLESTPPAESEISNEEVHKICTDNAERDSIIVGLQNSINSLTRLSIDQNRRIETLEAQVAELKAHPLAGNFRLVREDDSE